MKVVSNVTIAYLKTLFISPLVCMPVLIVVFSILPSGEYYNGVGIYIFLSVIYTFLIAYPFMLFCLI
ncbi:hypothetical protein TYM08_P2712 [Marinicellulosiphila megalodicopiae]